MQLSSNENDPDKSRIAQVTQLAPDLKAIHAPNPSPMTGQGTQSFLIGQGAHLALIDPGPLDRNHMDAIERCLTPGQGISHILLTHGHIDHSESASFLKERLNAKIYAYGPRTKGMSSQMQNWLKAAPKSGAEGVDHAFAYDVALEDGQVLKGDGWQLKTHWTPGHMAHHVAFEWLEKRWLFCGDLIMGWAPSLIAPPDGNLQQFYSSLDRVEALDVERLLPTHGAPIEEPKARIEALRIHRRARDHALKQALREDPDDLLSLFLGLYQDVPTYMHPAAKQSFLASLFYLQAEGTVQEKTLLEKLIPTDQTGTQTGTILDFLRKS